LAINVEPSLRPPTVKVRRALSLVRVDGALVLAEYWMAWLACRSYEGHARILPMWNKMCLADNDYSRHERTGHGFSYQWDCR
jgi:hypothetical protein